MREARSDLANKYLNLFRYAYQHVQPYWRAAQRCADRYNRIIDQSEWSTLSEVVIPFSWMAVEHMLPFVYEYVLPKFNPLSLIPTQRPLVMDRVEEVERLLTHTAFHRMNLRTEGVMTLKDMIKLGVGYGAVEAVTTRSEAALTLVASNPVQVIARERVIGLGPPKTVPSYRYVPFGHVVPMLDGYCPNTSSGYFWLDIFHEHTLRAMYEEDSLRAPDDRQFMSSIDEIVKDAARFHGGSGELSAVRSMMATIANMAQHPVDQQQAAMDYVKKAGVSLIPVLRCEFKGEHVWLANGQTVIKHIQADNLRPNLVKASAWLDSGKWFTPGIVEPAEDVELASLTIYNAFLDVLTYHLHPSRVINKQMLVDQTRIPKHQPYEDILIRGGDARQALSYIPPPPMEQGLFSIADQFQNFDARTRGQPLAAQGQGSPGLLRGGVGAFETMLQGSYGREKLVGALTTMTWLKPVLENTLAVLQSAITEDGITWIARVKGVGGKMVHAEKTVTQDDILHAFDVVINLDEKYRQSATQDAMRIQLADRMFSSPFLEQDKVWEFLINDDALAAKLLPSKEKIAQVSEQVRMQVAQILAAKQAEQLAQQQAMQAQRQRAGSSRMEQAMAGGAAQRQGMQR